MNQDIITVIAQLGVGFRALNLTVPEAIVLKSADDGMRLLYLLAERRGSMTYHPGHEPGVSPVEGENGAVYMQITIYGMNVRWPARLYATPGCRGGKYG